jgi:hypothetical protein
MHNELSRDFRYGFSTSRSPRQVGGTVRIVVKRLFGFFQRIHPREVLLEQRFREGLQGHVVALSTNCSPARVARTDLPTLKTVKAVLKALQEASVWLDDLNNRPEQCDIVARATYINCDAKGMLC